MRHYYLGMAAGYSDFLWLKHLLTWGRKRDCDRLIKYLDNRYGGKTVLCKNGRSALTIALRAYFKPGDAILVNGFTCYAVYEAVKAAKLKPVFVDINKETLNFDNATLTNAIEGHDNVRGIIIQNTLGNPVDIDGIESFSKKHNLIIIEDLAHCAGVRYSDRREAGTVGAASVLSFGKDKSIDTVSGGAVILREEADWKALTKRPRLSDHLRAKFYPMLGALCRTLTHVRLGGALMRLLVKVHWVERSADNKLDCERRISKFEAKRALSQIRELRRTGEPPLRDFYLVDNRTETLRELQKNGFYFGSFWYERPVSPERYYKKVRFPEKECPNATFVAEHIVNLPTYYPARDLSKARKIIKKHQLSDTIEIDNDGAKRADD